MVTPSWESGAPVAQWIKRWPTDLAVPGSIPTRGFLDRKRGSIAHSLSLSSAHRPDMTEIPLKRRSQLSLAIAFFFVLRTTFHQSTK